MSRTQPKSSHRRAVLRPLRLTPLLVAAVVVCAHVAAVAAVYVLPLRQHRAVLDGTKKFTKSIPSSNPKVQATRITALAGCASSGFSTPVTIGSQTFNVLVDSGSSTLAVAGTACSANNCGGGQTLSPLYTPSGSSQDLDDDVSVTYGSGSWSGRAYRDSVNLAGVGAVRMVIGAIETATDFFRTSKCAATFNQQNTYQGILGLAYGSLSPSPSDAYWDTLIDSNQGVDDVFAHQMCPGGSGRLWVGGYDNAFMTGSLTYTPITDKKWYVVSMGGMALGGSAVSVAASAYGTTIVDSGTTALLLPPSAYDAVTAAITANTYFRDNFGADFYTTSSYCVVPANGASVADLNAALPKLSISLGGGVTLDLNAVSSYLLETLDGDGTRYFCPGLSRNENAMTIMGYAALNQHIVVYDRANSRVGFAPQQLCDSTTTPPVTGHAWYSSAWGTCSSTDGTSDGCTHTRTAECRDSNGVAVAESQCDAAQKPALSESCESWASDAGPCAASEPSALESWWDSHPTARVIILVFASLLALCLVVSCIKCFCRTCCSCCCEDKPRRSSDSQQHFRSLHGQSHAQGRHAGQPAQAGLYAAPPPQQPPASAPAPAPVALGAGTTGATAGGQHDVAITVAN